LTRYRGDDPDGTPRVFAAGSGFVEGGDVHLVRNEGSMETVVYVTSLVPPAPCGGTSDEPGPGNCPF
jgi:hypothetical protein